MCLSMEKINDGIVDCIGAADEPNLCENVIYDGHTPATFHCLSDTHENCTIPERICDTFMNCLHQEDERACKNNVTVLTENNKGICTKDYELYGSDVAKVLCRRFVTINQRWKIYFTLDQSRNSIKQNIENENKNILTHQSINEPIEYYQQRCHRGLDLQVWLDKQKNVTRNVCLCPPSYYGDICQYQNQRISLTLQFRVTSDSVQIPFLIIISLIDSIYERIIHSSEQFTYLSIKHCQQKFNIYLLYSTRPKNLMKDYLIHIDIYEKTKLNYRASFIKILNFSFLPVHRVALQLDIPHSHHIIKTCSDKQCINGICRRYFNDPHNTFCQCKEGWSGKFCTIQHTCSCSSHSLCLGKLSNNRSLCVCSANKMGPRCLIDNTICQINQNETCLNNGECLTLNDKFGCICPKGFFGSRCEIVGMTLNITFDENLVLPSSIFIHFIEVKQNADPIRTTTFKTISIGQNSMNIHWSLRFHIAFVELKDKKYYLVIAQKLPKQSSTITKILNSSDRCLYINETFNETIANYSLLRRIKYYHLPCQTNLSCFYDEIHLCLCQNVHQESVANCFEFNHNMNMNCSGQSGCQNGGKCFQEDTNCPRTSICLCSICYHGRQCQLTTNGFTLSLDAILAFHIRPNINIAKQPPAILISMILSTIIIIGGIINGVLSLITFKNRKTRESGCGIYLLCSSIIILLLMISFTIKFWILIVSQIGLITNRLFLTIQCHSIDFLIRFCLTMDQWLTAFVSIERAYITIKTIHFNQKKTRLIAKWTIFGLGLVTIGTNIFDPIYRDLFEEDNDDEQKRLWCIVNYPSAVRIANLIINIFHFIVPFIINLTSAIIIIIIKVQKRASVQTQLNYRQIVKEQIHQHKNLLIGPCVLIILAIPRLIISFASGCMKSSNDSWLFLLGYFISLIPSMLTFILFVLPSTTYKDAFRKAISEYRKIFKRY